MKTVHIKSSLANVYQQFVAIADLETAKKFITDHIKDTGIKEQDKKKMCFEIETNIKSIYKLHYYITNALLKYEGLGVALNKAA